LSTALGQVASSTGAWLSAHPEAEAAVNTADENAIRTYFATHQAEWSELQGIASPLRSLRQSCPQQVSPGDVARLYDAMASRSVRSRPPAWTARIGRWTTCWSVCASTPGPTCPR